MEVLKGLVSGPPRTIQYEIVSSEVPETARLAFVSTIGAGVVALEFEDESFEDLPDDVVPPTLRLPVFRRVDACSAE